MRKRGWMSVSIVSRSFGRLVLSLLGFLMHWNQEKMGGVLPWNHKEIGTIMDTYQGVPVFENGLNYTQSYGKNYSKDGYYLWAKMAMCRIRKAVLL